MKHKKIDTFANDMIQRENERQGEEEINYWNLIIKDQRLKINIEKTVAKHVNTNTRIKVHYSKISDSIYLLWKLRKTNGVTEDFQVAPTFIQYHHKRINLKQKKFHRSAKNNT